jgi:hypothetical protein
MFFQKVDKKLRIVRFAEYDSGGSRIAPAFAIINTHVILDQLTAIGFAIREQE